jgi:hypothetical protein
MSVKTFLINNGQTNLGPFDMDKIIEMVNKLEIKATDLICVDIDSEKWMMICQHPDFLKAFEVNRPVVKPKVAVEKINASGPGNSPLPETAGGVVSSDLTLGQWFVLKGKNRFGPFMYIDVIRMLQERSLFEYDFVWCQGLDAWKRVAEISVFSPENIRGLFGGDSEISKVFHRRSYPRAHYECAVIIHDNNNIWKGKTMEIGEGGAGVIIENSLILPGQNIYLHFKPGPLSKPFNALSEVVSKRYVKGIKHNEEPVLYGVKFINIQKHDREALKMINSAA